MASKTPAAEKPQPAKRGAKPLAAAEVVGPQIDANKLPERNQELMALAKADAAVQALATNIGYAGALDTDSLWSMVEYRQRRSVEDILEMGRGLLLIKEQTPHGEFERQVGTRGMSPRMAQKFMAVALKFSKSDSKALLAAASTQTKVFELAVLDDGELEALNSGESVSGITLDDVERMSASELRRSLRDARADLDAKDQRVTKLSEDLNKEHEKTAKAQRKWKASSPDEKQLALEQRITAAETEILALIGTQETGLISAMIDLANHCNENESTCADFLGDMIRRLVKSVRLARDDYDYGFDIPVDAGKEG